MRALRTGLARGGRGAYRGTGEAAPPPAGTPLLDFTATAVWSSSDWIQVRFDDASGARNPLPMVPAPYTTVKRTTPMIAWPHVYTESSSDGNSHLYQVQYRVKAGPGSTVAITPAVAGRNYLILQTELTRGVEYEWRVFNAVASQWSDWRPFTVDANATSFLVPTGQALYTIAAAKAHPRTLPADFASRKAKFQAGGELRAYTTSATSDFNTFAGLALPWEGTTTAPYGTLRTEYLRIITCWWLWQIEGATSFRDEGLRRLRGLIKPYDGVGSGWLVTGGQSSYTSPGDDQAARSMIYAVSTGFDLFYDQLTSAERIQAANMVGARIESYINDTAQLGRWPMRSNWELSHPLNHIAVGGLAGLVFAGHESLTSSFGFSTNVPTWARNADFALQDFNGYADEEGLHRMAWGYARFQWEYAYLVESLGGAVGLDLWALDRNGLQAEAAYKLFPHDSSTEFRRPFGDSGLAGFRTSLALTYWLPRANGRWSRYMTAAGLTTSSVTGQRQWMLLRNVPPAAGTETRDDDPFYYEAGITAMHSNEQDASRVSLWMRACPLGSYGHNHMDHGSIVIAKGGLPLLIHAGSYGENGATDDVGSAYWDNYKRTWFKNCVTCDGRNGQQRYSTSSDPINARTRARFTRAVADEDRTYSYRVADLTTAYQHAGYLHSKAVRAVVFLKPNVYLVFDAHDLSSGSFDWQWLFHTKNQPTDNAGTVTITNGAASGTVKSLYANRVLLSKTLNDTAWPGGSSPGAATALEYHNSFNYEAGSSLRSCHMFVTNGVTGGATPSAASCTTDANGMVATVTLNGVTWTVSYNQTTDAVSVSSS
jgi:hypothetical protein